MTKTDPVTWQRLSPWALVLILVGGLVQFIRQNLYFFVGAGAGFAFIDWLGVRELALIGLAVVLVALVASLIFYRRFRFRLEDDAVRVRRGLIEQKELRVRYARIMNVNISQPFYLRPLGLVRFSLETPGASEKEMELPGISRKLAEEIRETVARHRSADPSGTAANGSGEPTDEDWPKQVEKTGRPIYRARTVDLLLHGLASNQVWVLAGALATVYGAMEGTIRRRVSDIDLDTSRLEALGSPWLLLFGGIAGLLILVMLASVIISWVRFHRFVLEEDGQRLRTRAGLLDRREQTVPRAKLHAFTLVQTAIGVLVGRWYLIGRQAGAVSMDEGGGGAGRFLVPGLSRKRLFSLLEPVSGSPVIRPQFNPITPLFRQVMGLRLLVLFAAGIVAAGTLLDWSHPVTAILAGLALPALGLLWLRWRRWGWCLQGDRLWVKSGLFGQHIHVFSTERVQQVAITQSPVQIRRNLASLELTLPHGALSIPWIDLETARQLANGCLWHMETAAIHQV